MLMVNAFFVFDRRDGKHVHQKMFFGDDHPKNLVRSRQDEHHLLNLKFHATAIPQLRLAVVVLYTHCDIPWLGTCIFHVRVPKNW